MTSEGREGFDRSDEGLGGKRSGVVASKPWRGVDGRGRGALEGAQDRGRGDAPCKSCRSGAWRGATSCRAGGGVTDEGREGSDGSGEGWEGRGAASPRAGRGEGVTGEGREGSGWLVEGLGGRRNGVTASKPWRGVMGGGMGVLGGAQDGGRSSGWREGGRAGEGSTWRSPGQREGGGRAPVVPSLERRGRREVGARRTGGLEEFRMNKKKGHPPPHDLWTSAQGPRLVDLTSGVV